MTKREIRKEAYRLIVKENKTHQETFDELRQRAGGELETLADEVAKVPSLAKQKEQMPLIYVYVALLAIVIIVRVIGVAALAAVGIGNPSILLIAVLLGLVVPVVGIIGAFTRRAELYMTVGILLIVNLVRSFTNEGMAYDLIAIIVLALFAATIALSFILPYRLKTKYTKKVRKEELGDRVKTSLDIVFDESNVPTNSELLDT